MPHGGYRVGAGRKRGSKYAPRKKANKSKVCLLCGTAIIKGSGRSSYCSAECSKEAGIKKAKIRRKKKPGYMFKYKLICLRCGNVFIKGGKPGGTQKFCSDECRVAYRVETRAAFKERVCVQCGKIFMSQNPSSCCSPACVAAHRKKTKEEKRVKRNEWEKIRRRTDVKYVIRNRMRSIMFNAIRRGKAGKRWQDLLGYTVDDLKKHLQKQFKDGMTWERFLNGEIHIDHKIPVAVHNFKKPSDYDFKRCFALSNLQPLWAFDNISKGARINKPFQQSLCIGA